ncbi:MAG TPA: 4-hydroxyphenylpyruvate dioxygenase, partial [Bryobacteraceae bacterium]|nr:4-hydroxyphenylpyruvate dioxygenase [Bryobacteraceae bacterium]
MPQTAENIVQSVPKDFLPINGTDHVEFYVGNAKQAAYYYRAAFGFRLVAYAGPETGVRETVSWVVQQDKIRFVLTTALRPEHAVAQHVQQHGDGVRSIALWVDDAESAYEETTKRGARGLTPPHTLDGEFGQVRLASIALYGDTIHTFVERKEYHGMFLPGYRAVTGEDPVSRPSGLRYVDHMVANVALGEMNRWVRFYEDVMGFRLYQTFDDKDISTEYSALMSKVMANGNSRIKFPINEPAAGKRKSQIDEYLDFYQGPGVQHIAMITDDIIGTVSKLRSQGVEFLRVPSAYYET